MAHAFIAASAEATRYHRYAAFADALTDAGVPARVSDEGEPGAICLQHMIAGDAAAVTARLADPARTVPLQVMLDGAGAAIDAGAPAAILKDAYARWAAGTPGEASGLVTSIGMAKRLGLPVLLAEGNAALIASGGDPLPVQLAAILRVL